MSFTFTPHHNMRRSRDTANMYCLYRQNTGQSEAHSSPDPSAVSTTVERSSSTGSRSCSDTGCDGASGAVGDNDHPAFGQRCLIDLSRETESTAASCRQQEETRRSLLPTGGSPNGVPYCPYESRQRYDQLSVYNDNTTRMSFSSDEMRFKSILLDDRVTRPAHKECIFVDKYDPPPTFGSMKLQPDAARSLTVPNAGGQSVLSEILSIQYMTEIYGART